MKKGNHLWACVYGAGVLCWTMLSFPCLLHASYELLTIPKIGLVGDGFFLQSILLLWRSTDVTPAYASLCHSLTFTVLTEAPDRLNSVSEEKGRERVSMNLFIYDFRDSMSLVIIIKTHSWFQSLQYMYHYFPFHR